MTDDAQKGQAVVEFIYIYVASSFLFIFISAFFYLYYAKTISSYYSHRALFCMEEKDRSIAECKKDLSQSLNRSLFFKKKLSITLFKEGMNNKSEVSFKFLNKHFNWKKQIKVNIE